MPAPTYADNFQIRVGQILNDCNTLRRANVALANNRFTLKLTEACRAFKPRLKFDPATNHAPWRVEFPDKSHLLPEHISVGDCTLLKPLQKILPY